MMPILGTEVGTFLLKRGTVVGKHAGRPTDLGSTV